MIKQFLQRFFKGQTSDIEPSQQPNDTVRDSNNMRVVAENKNTVGDQNLLGTIKTLNLNPNYFPIGWAKLANQIVIFSTKDITGTDQNGEIGVATINPITLVGTYTPMYNHVALAFNSEHQIECRGYDENESKRRVYWTDDYNTLRAINLLDPILNTTFLVGALIVGDVYMVVRGSVTNNVVDDYGPNEALGTVFTADGTEVYNTADTRVIEYLDVSLIDAVPTRDQGNISYNRWLAGGQLLGGGYQYCYQLQTADGIVSNFSYVTKVFHTSDPTTPSSSSVDYQAVQGSLTNEDSGKGIRITIDNIDINFNVIRVVAIRSIGFTATDSPVIIFEGNITGSTMDFDHFGDEQLGSLSVDDLAAIVLAIRRVNTLDILKQRMFIGNVKLAPYIDFNASAAGVIITPIEYRFQTDKIGRPDDSGDSTTAGLMASGYEPETGLTVIDTDQWYEVLTTPVTYNAVVYAVGDTFQGVATVHVYVGAGTVQAVTRLQNYTGSYRLLPVRDDYTDTKNAGVATVLKSLWRGETYRTGILIYDVFGNPQYVHWVADWEVPAIYATTDPNTGAPLAFNPRLTEQHLNDYGGTTTSMSVRSIGQSFSNIDFTPVATALGVALADLDRYIGGWSIVRAKRDKQVISQGILLPSTLTGTDVRPQAPSLLVDDLYFTGLNRRKNAYFWYSPEMLFYPAGATDGDILEVVDYVQDTIKAFVGGTLDTSNFHYYDKHFVSSAPPPNTPAKGTQNNLVVANCVHISPNSSGVLIGTTGDSVINASGVSGGGIYGVNPRYCVGGFTYLMYTQTAEPTVPWDSFASRTDAKSLVNHIRPRTNLYGGQSDAAKAATEYIHCGHYQPMDAAFMAYMVGNAGVVNDVEVFGGDTYISVLDVARMMREDNGGVFDAISFGAFFAVESSLNMSMRQGRHLAKDRSCDETQPLINTNGISYSNPLQPEQWVYNAGYSYEESQLKYLAVPLNYLPNNNFMHRVYGSLTKVDGELIDGFRQFPINDFIDVDGTRGEIINLRAKNDRLFYFQPDAVSYLPINERETIPNQLGAPVTLGTGGALQRYDGIVTYYGNQHQFGLGETEDAFIFFDARRKELVTVGVGAQTVSLSLVDGLRNEFSNLIGDFLTNDNPVRNNGIAMQYNQPLKEMMISFRGVGDPSVVSREPYAPIGFSVGYDNMNKQFTGKFDLLPGIMLEFNNILIVAYTAQFSIIIGNRVYAVGDRLTDGTSIYVCILAYTATLVPVIPSVDTTHWKLIMEMNEVHISDKGPVCRFFGYVYPNSISVIVNPDFYEDKVFDNCVWQSSQNFFDTLTAATSYQTGTDTAITSSEEYRYIYTSWHNNLPFDASGDRMRDKYLTLTLAKDNKLNGQYWQSKDERVKIVSLITNYRKTY